MNIEQEILALQERNKRVEADKAWETSWSRKGIIMVITYIVAVAWLVVIDESNYLLKAVVPVAGFFLSTITVPPLKRYWTKKFQK